MKNLGYVVKKDVNNFDADCILSPTKRKCDYETVFRCKNAGSDSESDDESPSCFNFKLTTSKQKTRTIQQLQESTPSVNNTVSDQIFKVPQTPPSRSRPIRTALVSSKYDSRSISNRSSDSSSIKSDDYDPTYGFANRFSDTKSYFRTHNVDSIPNSINPTELLLGAESTPVLDTLFPLRQGSGKCETSWLHKRSFEDKENTTNFEEQTFPKKRVKFEDQIHTENSEEVRRHRERPDGFNFPGVSANNRISLAQRIIDFFASMF